MEEIMKLLRELATTFKQKIEELTGKTAKCDATAKEQEATAEKQTKQQEDLDIREEKNARIESVVAIEAKNKETLQDINTQRESLATAAGAHNSQASKDKHDLGVQQADVQSGTKALEQGQKELVEAQEKLKKDEDTMRERIIAEIADKIKK